MKTNMYIELHPLVKDRFKKDKKAEKLTTDLPDIFNLKKLCAICGFFLLKFNLNLLNRIIYPLPFKFPEFNRKLSAAPCINRVKQYLESS